MKIKNDGPVICPIDGIRHLLNRPMVKNEETARICEEVLSDKRFAVWSGAPSSDKHHYGYQGLAIHTEEVMKICFMNYLTMNGLYDMNLRVLMVAALWHDYGKCWDYKPTWTLFEEPKQKYASWQPTEHRYKFNHLCRSAIEWTNAVQRLGICADIHDDVLHCILAHHAEHGSPVQPQTREAWLLHLSDNISARLNDCFTFKKS